MVEIAAEHRGVAAGIALIDGGWIRLRDSFKTWEEALGALTPPDLSGRSWTQLSAMMRAAHPDWADWADWAINASLANLRRRSDGTVRARLPRDHHLSILRSMWDHPISDRFDEVDVPSLLVPAGQRAGRKLEAVDRAAELSRDHGCAGTTAPITTYMPNIPAGWPLNCWPSQNVPGSRRWRPQRSARTRHDAERTTGDHGIGRDRADHDQGTPLRPDRRASQEAPRQRQVRPGYGSARHHSNSSQQRSLLHTCLCGLVRSRPDSR